MNYLIWSLLLCTVGYGTYRYLRKRDNKPKIYYPSSEVISKTITSSKFEKVLPKVENIRDTVNRIRIPLEKYWK